MRIDENEGIEFVENNLLQGRHDRLLGNGVGRTDTMPFAE
jgi:hypothetical protein